MIALNDPVPLRPPLRVKDNLEVNKNKKLVGSQRIQADLMQIRAVLINPGGKSSTKRLLGLKIKPSKRTRRVLPALMLTTLN